jgi:alpha-tubulin suppressor-like RCC1 family protein
MRNFVKKSNFVFLSLIFVAISSSLLINSTSRGSDALGSENAWTIGWGGVGNDAVNAAQPLEDGSIITISNGGSGTLAKKFDTNGSLQWSLPLDVISPAGGFNGEGSMLLRDGRALFFGSVEQNPVGQPQIVDAVLIAVSTNGVATLVSQFGGPSWESVKTVGMCSDGSFFVGGTVGSGSVDPGNTLSVGLADLFVARFDSNYNRLWIKQFGSTNNDALFSASCGTDNSVVISAWGAASINGQGSNDYYNFYVIKYGAAGNLISTVESERDIGYWSPQSGVTAPDGSMYVVGEHNGNRLGDLPCTESALGGSFVSKYSTAGVLVWRKIIDCGNRNIRAAVDAWGNLYVLGAASSKRIAGQQKYGGEDFLLHKYTSDGERLWTRQFGSINDDGGSSIAIDNDGNVIIGGATKGLFDGYQTANEWDALLIKNRIGETGVKAGPPENLLPPSYVPVDPLEMTFKAVSAGEYHSCGLLTNSEVWCWGRNGNGELGVGSTIQSFEPIKVDTLRNTTSISAGGSHTCAVNNSGEVKCWGYNLQFQLGSSTIANSLVPVTVPGLSGISMLSAGTGHTCAVNSDGQVVCWGFNDHGQVGNGTNQSRISTPTVVAGVSNAISVASGGSHTCAVLASGFVKCWGANDWGQLGDNSGEDKWSPTNVSGINNAITVAVGISHSCATLNTGSVKCWGRNDYGQIGDGTSVDASLPTAVSGIDNSTQLALGRSSTCARLTTGDVKCWGRNSVNELGNGTSLTNLNKTMVSNLSTASIISSNYAHTCSVTSTGNVFCWGYNSNGQLGDGTYISTGRPASVKITQEITVNTPTSMLTSDEAATLEQKSTRGLSLTYTSNTPLVCSVESYQLLALSSGTCRLTIRQPGNAAFYPAIAINKSVQIAAPSSLTTSPESAKFISTTTSILGPSTTVGQTIVTTIINTLKLTISKTITAKSIATDAKLKVASTSKVALRVLPSSAKFCKVSGSTLKGLKAGTCKVTVTVTPKKGKALFKTVMLKIAK